MHSDTLLDPLLPLIDIHRGTAFTLANGMQGLVHPQRRDKDNTAHHRFLFYVEYPAGHGQYHEVDAHRLASLAGEKVPSKGFTHTQFAGLLANIPAVSHFPKILHAINPTQ